MTSTYLMTLHSSYLMTLHSRLSHWAGSEYESCLI